MRARARARVRGSETRARYPYAYVIDDESITRGQEPGMLSRNRIRGQNGRFRSYRSRFTAALWIPLCPAPRSLTRVALATLRPRGNVRRVNKIAAPPPLRENVLTPGVTWELCGAIARQARMRVCTCVRSSSAAAVSFSLSLCLSRPVRPVDNWNDNDYDVTDVTIMEQQIHADRLRPMRLGICLIYGNIYTSDGHTTHAVIRFKLVSLSGMTFRGLWWISISRRCSSLTPHLFRSYYRY